MVESVDTQDLKSCDRNGRAGSSPAPGTNRGCKGCKGCIFIILYILYILYLLYLLSILSIINGLAFLMFR